MFERLFQIILGLLVLGTGLFTGYYGLRFLRDEIQSWQSARASQAWPSTTGWVIDAEIQKSYGRLTTHSAKVCYRYHVGEQQYIGTRMAFDFHDTHGMTQAEAVVKQYAPGQSVRVFYDPHHPHEATLENNISGRFGIRVSCS